MIDVVAIERAVVGRHITSGWYASSSASGLRVFHPHVLYITRDGTLMVDVVQVDGATSRATPLPSWRAFKVDGLSDLRIREETFRPSPDLRLSVPKYHRILAHCLGNGPTSGADTPQHPVAGHGDTGPDGRPDRHQSGR